MWANPNCDERAETSIGRLNFEARVLRWRKSRINKRTKEITWRVRRLLPRYVFVRVPTLEKVGLVRGCDGVQDVLNVRGRHLVLTSRAMANLTALEAIEEFEDGKVERSTFEPGDAVTVTSGPFKGKSATVVARYGRNAVGILFDLFVSTRPVRIAVDAIAKAS